MYIEGLSSFQASTMVSAILTIYTQSSITAVTECACFPHQSFIVYCTFVPVVKCMYIKFMVFLLPTLMSLCISDHRTNARKV